MTFPRYESPLSGVENFRPLGGYTLEGIWPDAWAKEGRPPQDSYIEVPASKNHLEASDLIWFIDGVPWFVWLWGASLEEPKDGLSAYEWDPVGDSISGYLGMGELKMPSPLKAQGYLDGRVLLDRGAVLIFPEPADRAMEIEETDCDNVGCLSEGAPSLGLEF